MVNLVPRPRTFYLDRVVDSTGVSGTGVVAWGVEFPDGRVAMRWNTDIASTTIHDDLGSVEAIHGHGGNTVLRFYDN